MKGPRQCTNKKGWGKRKRRVEKSREQEREKSRIVSRKERMQGLEENNSAIFCKQCVIFFAENSGDSTDQKSRQKASSKLCQYKKKKVSYSPAHKSQLDVIFLRQYLNDKVIYKILRNKSSKRCQNFIKFKTMERL